MVSITARAKVNLTLGVIGKRNDGYHTLQSLVVFADFGDQIRIEKSEYDGFSVTGPYAAGLGENDDNLVIRARNLFRERSGMDDPVRIHLDKKLPVASGIGGGSADAAATLRLLDQLLGHPVPEAELEEASLELGADLPVCLRSSPCWMSGIGEILELVHIPEGIGLVLVNCGHEVPTGVVFIGTTKRSPGLPSPGNFSSTDALSGFLSHTGNDLTEAAISVCREIEQCLSTLQKIGRPLASGMSGSGATCYAIYPDRMAATEAAGQISTLYPGWWVQGGVIS